MEVIPAIDLLGGQAVRLVQGDYAQAEIVSPDPVAQAVLWAEQGASRLHLVDLDGAKSGDRRVNQVLIERILVAISIPVQVGGGIRSLAAAEDWLALGVERVILGTVAVEQPELVDLLCQRHAGRIVVGIDARDGLVATRGWAHTTPVPALDLIEQMNDLGVAAIIYTDIARDGTLGGPNLDQLRPIAQASRAPVIASGGIRSVADLLSLLALAPLGVSGAIVGKALYSGSLSLTEAIRAVGSGRWQDVWPEDGTQLA